MIGEFKLLAGLGLIAAAFFAVKAHDAGIRREVEQVHQAAAAAELQANTAKIQELVNANQKLQAARTADRAALADASRRLRERLAGSGLFIHPTTPGAVQDAPDAAGVCAALLDKADARLRILADVADERGDALEGCVGAHDALSR